MNLKSNISAITYAWVSELKTIVKDQGVLLFFVFLPLAYPLIYSWIYTNEVVREVPVVVVDDSHSALSREFVRKFDASPDVSVAYQCGSIAEAQDVIGHGKAYGILYFPADFQEKNGRMEQTHVSVYCDMSYMLTYKAIFQTATNISGEMGAGIQKQLLGKYTKREEEIGTKPLDFDDVPIFNVTGGYGNFILPAVLVLIIQQALALGVGMLAGTEREKQFANYKGKNPATILTGKTLAVGSIFAVMLAWITLVVPHIFGFVSMVHGCDLLQFLTPYLLACIFFAICISELVRYRESVILVVVFSSIILLFLSGVSWPMSAVPPFWEGVAAIFPSTNAIRGFVRMSSMGALLPDVATEYHRLWIQTVVYALLALLVVWRRAKVADAQSAER